ncbi:MAG TPA: sulfurtransferase TusA family protein [Candidatus Lokiarchaeia archaeon]|nr:sulfurtransferase TusA family protein [Candidatus Lokiarchaeia archaeon]
MEDVEPAKSIDTVGLYCPVPLFKTREAIDEIQDGEVLEVLADDPAAEEDIKRFAKRTGNELLLFENNDGTLRFLIRKISKE